MLKQTRDTGQSLDNLVLHNGLTATNERLGLRGLPGTTSMDFSQKWTKLLVVLKPGQVGGDFAGKSDAAETVILLWKK